ncbi:BSD domain containing protein, partial [Striga asiatica]
MADGQIVKRAKLKSSVNSLGISGVLRMVGSNKPALLKLNQHQNGKRLKPKMALKNEMWTPLSDGQSNRVTINLTPEIIHQIFAEKPAVRQAYLKFVPKKTRNFGRNSQELNISTDTKKVVVVAAEAAEDEELAIFLKKDDILTKEARKKDHGLCCEESKDALETQYEPYRRDFSRDLNQHAAVVLQGRVLGFTVHAIGFIPSP